MSRLVRGTAGAAVFSLVVAGLALVPAGVASATTGNALTNGSFAGGSTSGWKGTNAALSAVSGGTDADGYAALVKRSTGTSYAMYTSPRPATSLAAGTQLQGTGEVSGPSGKSICLQLQEYTSGGSLVQTKSSCVTASGSWQAIGPPALTVKTTGDSVGLRIRQSAAVAGNSFQADALSLTESAAAPPPTATAPVVTGNAGDWPLQEISGTTAHDIAPSPDNGTVVGPVTLGAPGPNTTYPHAYSFPGSTKKSTVDVPYASKLVAGTANIDISFWLNTTHLPGSGDFDLVRMGDYPFPEYKVELLTSNKIACTFHGSANGNATGGSSLANGQWHFVQCVKTSSQIQLFIDGNEVASVSKVIGSVTPSQDAFFGAHGLPGTTAGFDWYNGKLADVEFSFG